MRRLPFADDAFDKAVSITAIEFIEDAVAAVEEMFRVAKPGGIIVVATLNSLSPWAQRREEEGKKGHPLFRHTVFRSPEEIAGLSPVQGIIQTAIHFKKDDDVDRGDRNGGKGKGSEHGSLSGGTLDKAVIRIGRYNPVQNGFGGKSVSVSCRGRGRPNVHCR